MRIRQLASQPKVRHARSLIGRRDGATVEEQARIAAIPAPTGSEAARGAYLRERFTALGLAVEEDEVGNILARLDGGASENGGGDAPVVVAAHLDSIFPAGTDVNVRYEEDRILGPGITDDARGLAALLAAAGAMREAELSTLRPVLFAATVGEEGIGDLRGIKHLFREGSALRNAAAVLVVDGAGDTRIVTRAVGATRVRVTLEGPGGHSWGDRGRPNPAHAAAHAVAEISELAPPGDDVDYSVNVGRIGGGTSVNSIPAAVWFELDLRADRGATLDWLERQTVALIEAAADRQSERAGRHHRLETRVERIGSRPCGTVATDAPVVRATAEVTRYLGLTPEFVASSTDANVPIALGIPAVAIGAGGRAGGIHTLDEWFENQEGARGIERVLLTVLAFAGVQGFDPLV